jgi:hypothetical protein
MQKWEYDVVRSRGVLSSRFLDERGDLGWELVVAYYDDYNSGDHIYYFKRPVS